MVIGLLALQGCVEPHAEHLQRLGVSARYVRKASDLSEIDGLILPGGESTTMSRLIRLFDLEGALLEKAKQIPFWGICAGSILMARKVVGKLGPHQLSLGLIRATVERNAYGRQLESFHGNIRIAKATNEEFIEGIPFIRAPGFVSWDEGTEVIAFCEEKAVALKDGIHLISSFHPELSDSSFFHQYFVELCQRTKKRNTLEPPPASI